MAVRFVVLGRGRGGGFTSMRPTTMERLGIWLASRSVWGPGSGRRDGVQV